MVFRKAQKFPNQFFIGLDSNADNLIERSRKSCFASKKGALANLLYVHAGAESLPSELTGVATEITIILPWGSLLRAAAGQDILMLKNIRQLCSNHAKLWVVFGYESQLEQKMIDDLSLPMLTEEYLNTHLKKTYLEAGFDIQWRYLQNEELKQVESTWAKKLAYGKKRQFVEVNGYAI